MLSNAGYGVFFDSAAMATLEPGDAPDGAWLEYRSSSRPLDLYFIGGDGLRQVLGDVAMLLGRATMPPRWALGYTQSSRHFTDAAEVRDLPHSSEPNACRAMRSSSCLPTAPPLDGIVASGIWNLSRTSSRTPTRCWPNSASSISASSRMNTPCCTKPRLCSPRPKAKATCWMLPIHD